MLSVHEKASLGVTFVVVSSFFYASYGIWTTLMGDFFGGYTASAIRSVLVLVILLVVAAYFRQFEPIQIAKNSRRILGMIAASTLVWGPLYYSVQQVGMGLSLSVNYSAIVIGMLMFGGLIAKEQLTRTKMLSAGLGIVGMFLVFIPTMNGSVLFVPLALAVMSGLAIAVNTILAKQLTYNTTQQSLFLWLTSVVANTPLAFVLNEPAPVFELRIEWLYVLLFAVASVLASWLLLAALKYIDAGSAGVLGLLEIVFSVIFGVLLFHEQLQTVALLGIGVIMVAAAYPYVTQREEK